MLKRFFVALGALLLVPAFLAAQVLPTPAPELAKYKGLEGHWAGTGTFSGGPGMPPASWKSTSTCQWVLNGHYLQEDMKVTFDPPVIPAMVFRTYYGWDVNEGKYVAYDVANEGMVTTSQNLTWLDDNTLVRIDTRIMDGTPLVQRVVLRHQEDGWHFSMNNARGVEAFTTPVEGTLKPAESGYSISEADWQSGFGEPAPEMAKVKGMLGSYSMSGEMIPAPGMPAMQISSKETYRSVFGGAVMMFHVVGDPMPGDESGFRYEGYAFWSWSPEKKCYDEIFVSNMGHGGDGELRWVDDKKLVGTDAGMSYGMPHAARSTMILDETGAVKKVSMDRIGGAGKVERAFIGEYQKQASADEKKPEKM